MNILVVGCGKVGSRLATSLSRDGHEVSVIAPDESAFDVLDPNDNIFTTTGIPIDQDVLRAAGIENCDAVAAVSQDDNVNIMVTQVAREIFHIERVIARIFDPLREDVFSHFGLPTICPTNISVNSLKNALLEPKKTHTVHFGSHTVSYITVDVPANLVGESAHNLDFADNQALFAIIHGKLHIQLYTGQKVVLEKTDRLIIAEVVD